MWSEFKTFIARGSVLDLAVGIIIGAAFTAIVNSLVGDLIMPLISLITGGVDFNNLFAVLRAPAGADLATLKAARESGAVVFAYGAFIQAIINFLIIAFVIFLIVRQANQMRGAPPPPDTKDCPFCFSKISLKATRCPNCTSQLGASGKPAVG
jgi:large conductance mechanosensitive channel